MGRLYCSCAAGRVMTRSPVCGRWISTAGGRATTVLAEQRDECWVQLLPGLSVRRLSAVLYLPSLHRPGCGKLPVLLDPYGGAGRQQVTAELDWRSLVSQWFAEQGFAVLAADGRGTPGRGSKSRVR